MADLDNILATCLNKFEYQQIVNNSSPTSDKSTNKLNSKPKVKAKAKAKINQDDADFVDDLLADLPGLTADDVSNLDELLGVVEETKNEQRLIEKNAEIAQKSQYIYNNCMYSKAQFKKFSISKLKKMIKSYIKLNVDCMTSFEIEECDYNRFIEKRDFINCLYKLYNGKLDKLQLMKPSQLISHLKLEYGINPTISPYFINEKDKLCELILKLNDRKNLSKMSFLLINGYIREECNKILFEWIIPQNMLSICYKMYHISYKKLFKLCGNQFIRKNGEICTFHKDIVGKDLIAFYFSGKWCPPSKIFTAKLKKFYKYCMNMGYSIEIIFVSSDRSEDAMMDYFRNHHADYLAIPFGSNRIKELDKVFNVTCIPTLCIVNDQTDFIDVGGRGTVISKGNNAIDQWMQINKSILQKKCK